MKKINIKIAQISDSHLLNDSTLTIHGVNPFERLLRVLEYVKKNRYEIIFFTGDLANDGNRESYRQLWDLIKDLENKYCIIPGNHDDLHEMLHVLPQSNLFTIGKNPFFKLNNWYFLYLDTTVQNKNHGYISELSIKALKNVVKKLKKCNICVIMHHHPFNVGVNMVDKYKIINFDSITDLLVDVKLVLYGHVHNDYTEYHNGKIYSSCPSTCFQFVKDNKINNHLYGFKEYRLSGENIFSNCIWFSE